MALTPLDFPASPTVGQLYPDPPVTGQPTYRWDGAQWLSYAAASLPTPTKPANYGKKNYIINGAMQVSQENGATAGTVSGFYPADMFSVSFTGTSGALSTANNPTVTPGGSSNRLRVAVTLADAAVAAGDAVWITTVVEGLRYGDLRFGSAAAKTITIQFGVRAPAGTYCVALRNGTADRSYVAEYVIAAGEANTDVMKSVTLTGDLAGTWAAGNSTSAGVLISWGLMVGGTYQTPAGSWVASNFMGSSNQFNFMGTLSNIFDLFDVSLTEGSVAPPFQVPDYASELALCQRYYYKASNEPLGLTASAFSCGGIYPYKVVMRATPAVTGSFNVNSGNAGTFTTLTAPAGPSTTCVAVYNSAGNWTINAMVAVAIVLNARL